MKTTCFLLLMVCCGSAYSQFPRMKDKPQKIALDTIYFPFYDGVQMIMVNHLKKYNDEYGPAIMQSMYMSQMPVFPAAPEGNEYFFRNRDGEIIKSFNTYFSNKVLSCYFQSLVDTSVVNDFHVNYYSDTNLYYPSKNMHIHNAYYKICKKAPLTRNDRELRDYERGQIRTKYGLIDTLGNIVLDMVYEQILTLPKGFLVQKDGKWGIVNKKQAEVLAFEYDYHSTDYYYFDNYPMEKELTYLMQDGLYKVAYFMKHDSLIYLDDYYSALLPKKGLFIMSENDKYGIVDLVNNKVLIPPKYDKPAYSAFRFHDPNKEFYHLEHAYIIAEKNGKYGMINLKNKVVLPFKYDKIFTKHESPDGYFKAILKGKTVEIKQ